MVFFTRLLIGSALSSDPPLLAFFLLAEFDILFFLHLHHIHLDPGYFVQLDLRFLLLLLDLAVLLIEFVLLLRVECRPDELLDFYHFVLIGCDFGLVDVALIFHQDFLHY